MQRANIYIFRALDSSNEPISARINSRLRRPNLRKHPIDCRARTSRFNARPAVDMPRSCNFGTIRIGVAIQSVRNCITDCDSGQQSSSTTRSISSSKPSHGPEVALLLVIVRLQADVLSSLEQHLYAQRSQTTQPGSNISRTTRGMTQARP